MSSIGTGYDLSAATFSPDGRIFQIEYASKAVESSATVIALASKLGVLVAVDQPIPSKLSFEDANTRIMDVDDKIGFVGSGLYPDVCSLHDYTREEANKYLRENRQPVNIKKLANTIAEHVHIYTLSISRPYGASFFLIAWDDKGGPSIYGIDPSGLCHKYHSWVIGKHAQAAKTEIEKIESRNELNQEGLMKRAIRIILTIRDEGASNQTIEMGWTGRSTNGNYQRVDQARVDQLEQIVKQEMEDEEDA